MPINRTPNKEIEQDQPKLNPLDLQASTSEETGATPSRVQNKSLLERLKTGNMAVSDDHHYVSMKIALEAIPVYDGTNIPLTQFIEGCEEARDLLPPTAESSLVRLARNKLRGNARVAIQDARFEKIGDFINYIKKLYAPAETVYQVQGKLGNIFQKDNENVVSYANRVRILAKRIKDAYQNEHGTVTEEFQKSVEINACSCFKHGLRSEIEMRMPAITGFAETIAEAVRIEKENLARMGLRNQKAYRETGRFEHNRVNQVVSEILVCQLCKRKGHAADTCWKFLNSSNQPYPNAPTSTEGTDKYPIVQQGQDPQTNKGKMCRYCKAPGHLLEECRKRMYNNSRNEKFRNQGNGFAPLRESVAQGESGISMTQTRPVTVANTKEENRKSPQ